MRWLIAIAVLLGSARADAAMMEHYDLAGLVLQSEAIVVAERGATTGDTTRYRVVKTLRGTLAATELDLHDRTYVATGTDARVVLFLTSANGALRIVQSGVRVTKGNLVFRFEQHANPGPYVMVPQGPDPQDAWGQVGAQLDPAGLERAIAAAARRVDAVVAARSERDPVKRRAAILAVFPVAPPGTASWGFYSDRLAQTAKALLADAGDLEGALLVEARDHSRHPFDSFAEIPRLLAIATDAKAAIGLRVIAIAVIARDRELYKDVVAIRAMIALVDDPAPLIRAAAVAAASRPAGVHTSDAAAQRALTAVVAEARAAIAKRYQLETTADVVFAIVDAFVHFRTPLPARMGGGGPAVVARGRIDGSYLRVELRCLRPVSAPTIGKVVATANGTPVALGYTLSFCNNASTGATADTLPPPGTYSVSVVIASKPAITIPLGTLVTTATAMTLTPP